MASMRLFQSSGRLAMRTTTRSLTTTHPRFAEPFDFSALNARANDTAPEYRKFQMEKPLNPHMTNTNSTISNEMPSIGVDAAPPEMITHVDPEFTPKDSVPENTARMTGGTQKPEPEGGVNADLKTNPGKEAL